MYVHILVCLFVLGSKGISNFESSKLPLEDIIRYQDLGHIMLRGVMPEMKDPAFIEELNRAKEKSGRTFQKYALEKHGCKGLVPRVDEGEGAAALKLCAKLKEAEDEDVDQVFYQLVQLHTHSDYIKRVATGERFASIASDLLQRERVRLYQTGTFRKIPSEDPDEVELFNQPTSMHTDLNQVPIDTNAYVTFWCPTRDTSATDSILTYASGSHADGAKLNWWTGGEEVEEPDPEPPVVLEPVEGETEEERLIREDKNRVAEEKAGIAFDPATAQRYKIEIYDDIKVGDCVAHHGWLLHACTSQSVEGGPREAMTFSYLDADARKLLPKEKRGGTAFFEEDGSSEDETSFNRWFYEIEEGGVIDHPVLIPVWPPAFRDAAASAAAAAAAAAAPTADKPQQSACELVDSGQATLYDKVRCNLEREKLLKKKESQHKKEL